MKPENDLNSSESRLNQKRSNYSGRSTERKLSRMGRRGFVKTATMLGVSGATLKLGDFSDILKASASPIDQVPYVSKLSGAPADGDSDVNIAQVPEYDTIQRDEWEIRHAAHNARKSLADKFQGLVRRPGVSISTEINPESPTGFGVKIELKTFSDSLGRVRRPDISRGKMRNQVPRKVVSGVGEGQYREIFRDIPVRVTQKEAMKTACESGPNYNKLVWQDVPAGSFMSCRYSQSGGDGSTGTINAPFYHPNHSNDGWITAGHVVDATNGYKVYSGDFSGSSNYVGKSRGAVDDWAHLDYAYIENLQGDEEVPYIVSPNGGYTDIPIKGIVTHGTLENRIGDTSYTTYTQGSTTNRQTGYVKNTAGYFGVSAVKVTNDVYSGDSGGPIYAEDGAGAWIIGVIGWYTGSSDEDSCSDGDDTEGTIAEKIQSDYGGGYITT